MPRPTTAAAAAKSARTYGKFRIVSGDLPRRARPVECAPLNIDETSERRRLGCRHYTGCVTYAAAQTPAWSSFSCESCPVQEPMTLDEWRRDIEGLTMFLRALGIKPSRPAR